MQISGKVTVSGCPSAAPIQPDPYLPYSTGRAALPGPISRRYGMPPLLVTNHAFTLVELVVVTALIGIMLVVAIPRLSGGLFSDGSDETARWIIAAVRQLKEKAIVEQKTYLLNVSPDAQRLWITDADITDTDADTAREDGYRLPRDIRIDHVAFTRSERISSGTIPIGFYPQGYSDKAVIRVRTGEGERLAFFIEPFLSRVDLVRGRQGW